MKLVHFVVVALAVLASACSPQATVAVKNDCNGAWFRLSWLENSGHYTVSEERLMPGDRKIVELTGTSGQSNKFVIMADGFSLVDGRSLGSATRDIWVSESYGDLTGPQNNYSWNISYLYPGGCPTR